MKKSIFAIAALAMGMTFAACGNSGKGGDADSTKKDQPAAEQQAQQPAQQETKSSADLQELQEPNPADFETEEAYMDALAKYKAEVMAKYNEGKEAVEEKVEDVEEIYNEGMDTYESAKEEAENIKKAAEDMQKALEGLGR